MNKAYYIVFFYTQLFVMLTLIAILRKSLSKKSSYLLATAVFVVILQFVVYFVFNSFTGKGFDESVRYHLMAGMIGLTRRIMIVYTLYSLLAIGLSLFLARVSYRNVFGENRKKIKTLGFLVVFCSIFFNPLTIDVYSFFNHPVITDTNELDKHFVAVDKIKLRAGEKKKNLIYIYLESFERALLDERYFPGLAPHLNKLASENKEFVNIDQTWGTGWTIAGMVASQCGIPLATFGNETNKVGKLTSEFLPGVNCISDLLKDSGYHLSYVGGAHLDFAGKGRFYKTHGFDDIRGEAELKKEFNLSGDDFHHWGVLDQNVFDHMLTNIEKLEKSKQPYVQMTLTLETHGPYSALSEKCRTLDFGAYKGNKMMEAYHCTDYQVGLLVEKLKKIVDLENTNIVVASDHFVMGSEINEYAKTNSRRNLFVLIDGSKTKVTKYAYSFDIAPTLLNLLGFEVEKIGFGRNLLVDEKRFPASGISASYLQSIEPLMMKFWHKKTL